MKVQIILRTYHTSGMHGDRATRHSPYRNYKVALMKVSDDPLARVEVEVADFDGYDHFNSSIRPDRKREAEEYVNKL